MKPPNGSYFNIGLWLTLALLIALILGGNGLVILQFERARLQTDRLTGVSQQLIAVLRLQDSLRLFHQRLNELVQSRDAGRLVTEFRPLRAALLEETRQTRSNLAYLPPQFLVDPAFVTALDTIEITLPVQLQDITDLAVAGDWTSVHLRLDDELRRIETTTSALVKDINRDLNEELPRAIANMRDVQSRIVVMVPATAISTVVVAALFGWAVTRKIILVRMEDRLNERTRIARDLHDTLLQSFQGAVMMFHGLAYRLPEGSETRTTLEGIIELAQGAVTECRDAVQELRSSTVLTNDLAAAFSALGEELAESAAEQAGHNSPAFSVRVEGPSRNLAPLVRDEVHRIGCEVVRNAFRHAEARSIVVEVYYLERQLKVCVLDNGKGIDPDILAAGGRAGHYGLPGMRERAKLLGGKLTVTSRPGYGTQAELTIPASFAYIKSLPTSWRPAAGRGSGA
jgi:signal transduction histidine kinase